MAAIAALKNYGSDDSDQDDVTTAEPVDTEDRRGYPLFTNPSTSTTGGDPFRTIMAVNSAPDVVTKVYMKNLFFFNRYLYLYLYVFFRKKSVVSKASIIRRKNSPTMRNSNNYSHHH